MAFLGHARFSDIVMKVALPMDFCSVKETLFSHDNILKLCASPPICGGEKEMSLDVHIAPDLHVEEQVRKGSKTSSGKNNNNNATHMPLGPKHPIPISSHE
jgi:hypothetical protein